MLLLTFRRGTAAWRRQRSRRPCSRPSLAARSSARRQRYKQGDSHRSQATESARLLVEPNRTREPQRDDRVGRNLQQSKQHRLIADEREHKQNLGRHGRQRRRERVPQPCNRSSHINQTMRIGAESVKASTASGRRRRRGVHALNTSRQAAHDKTAVERTQTTERGAGV